MEAMWWTEEARHSPFRRVGTPPQPLETTTTGICPAISGATQNSPCFECSRLDSYVSFKTSSFGFNELAKRRNLLRGLG